MLNLDAVLAARARIAPHVRHTPLLRASSVRDPITPAQLWMKLECLQPTGSFKVRGATNRWLTAPEDLSRGIVTASGGNHGLATARTAALAGVNATVFVPQSVTPAKLAKLEALGAEVRVGGAVWDEAKTAAISFAERTGAAFFHPFADAAVIAGQGTVALEIIEALPDLDVILVAVGGGGLIAGICLVLKALKPKIRIVGIEAKGSPTLACSLDAGHVVTLPEVTTRVATLACARTDERVFSIVQASVEQIALVEDEAMAQAARWLWFEFGLAADLSGAAAIAALQSGAISLAPGDRACALVCGSGLEGTA